MSTLGRFADNAAAAGFLGMIKREPVNRHHYRTVDEAETDRFGYSERLHKPWMRQRAVIREATIAPLTQRIV